MTVIELSPKRLACHVAANGATDRCLARRRIGSHFAPRSPHQEICHRGAVTIARAARWQQLRRGVTCTPARRGRAPGARPLSEYVSVVLVPRPDTPLTTRSAPLRMASTSRASSAAFLIQAPSFCVYMAKLAGPISALASDVRLERIADDDRDLVLHLLGGPGGDEDVGWVALAAGRIGRSTTSAWRARSRPCCRRAWRYRRPSRRTDRAASPAPAGIGGAGRAGCAGAAAWAVMAASLGRLQATAAAAANSDRQDRQEMSVSSSSDLAHDRRSESCFKSVQSIAK